MEHAVVSERPLQTEDLDIIEDDDGFIVYQAMQDRLHHLNASAALILECCDGTMTAQEIADEVRETFALAEPPLALVLEALTRFESEGLVA
jgi:hypothetical protein